MDISALEEITPKVQGSDVHLFDVRPALAMQYRKVDEVDPGKNYVAPNPPVGARVYYYLKADATQTPKLAITDRAGKKLAELEGPRTAGLHSVLWNLRATGDQKALVPAGEYQVALTVGSTSLSKKVKVESP
jgi:hypothetical protein